MRPLTLRSALILAACLCLSPVAAVAQKPLPPLDSKLTPDPVVTTGTLPNGLRYYVRTNGVPEHRVQFRLAVKTGSVFEADDQRGLAHMLEHMAFNGTAHFKPDELVNYFESAGARFGAHVNAQTSFDDTIYMLQVASDRPGLVDKALLALSDFAGGMTLTSGGDRQGAWRRHRGMAPRTGRGIAAVRQAGAGRLLPLAVRGAPADWHAGDPEDVHAPAPA